MSRAPRPGVAGCGLRLTLLALAVGALAGCGGGDSPGAAPAAPAPQLVDLASVDALRQQFAADTAKPRLLVLFAPT